MSVHIIPAGMLVSGKVERTEYGLRCDCPMPFGGTMRLVHCIVSPFIKAPDGIVEETFAMALTSLGPFGRDLLATEPVMQALPRERRHDGT